MPPQLGRKAWIGALGDWVVGAGCVGAAWVDGVLSDIIAMRILIAWEWAQTLERGDLCERATYS